MIVSPRRVEHAPRGTSRLGAPPSCAPPGERIPGVGLFLLLAATFVLHALSSPQPSGDTELVLVTASRIARQGRLDLPRGQPYADSRRAPGRVHERDELAFDFFPWGVAALTAPLVPLLDAVTGFEQALRENRAQPERGAQVLAGAVFTTVSTCMVVLLLFERERRGDVALAGGACFAFATPAWGVAAGALWMHGPAMMLLSAAGWLLARARRDPSVVPRLGWLVVVACAVRPSAASVGVLVGLLVVLRHRDRLAAFLLWALAAAVSIAWVNHDAFGTLLHPYAMRPHTLGVHDQLGVALLGHWVSAGRGLLVFSPVLALALFGARWSSGWRVLDVFFGATIVVHWLLISAFVHWTGGHCVGPRLFSDVIPAFVWFLGPVLRRVLDPALRHRALVVAFGLTLVVSVAAQARSAYDPRVWSWNVTPLDIDHPASVVRHFDYRDVQFLRRE